MDQACRIWERSWNSSKPRPRWPTIPGCCGATMTSWRPSPTASQGATTSRPRSCRSGSSRTPRSTRRWTTRRPCLRSAAARPPRPTKARSGAFSRTRSVGFGPRPTSMTPFARSWRRPSWARPATTPTPPWPPLRRPAPRRIASARWRSRPSSTTSSAPLWTRSSPSLPARPASSPPASPRSTRSIGRAWNPPSRPKRSERSRPRPRPLAPRR